MMPDPEELDHVAILPEPTDSFLSVILSACLGKDRVAHGAPAGDVGGFTSTSRERITGQP